MSAGQFLIIAGQLGLVLLVVRLFRVEELYGFLRILPLIFFGFLVHACLPLRYRLPFFLLLSLAAIGIIFPLPHSLGLIGLGLGLVGLCHLPIAYGARVALVLAAAAALVAVRAEWIHTSWEVLPTLVLPTLGSIFMFRMIIYLYDLRHEKKPATVWERLSYFFLLPNVCFPLFPLVDYQAYRRTYYDTHPHEIYQKGLLWMLRGVTHLLLYRVVYFYLTPAVADVQDLGGVVQFLVTNYLLYLRISGQFHLIIGILCLFGFNLPETHHLYYLASSFTDLWRRINIYWKDFMMKVVYYPIFMRFQNWGLTTKLVVTTVIVFVGTWLLHSYQWFWLRGTFPLTAPDGLFWGILGGLVAVNSVLEAKRGRKRSLGQQAWSFRSALLQSVKTLAMFAAFSMLWSLWSSSSVGEWIKLLSAAGNSGPEDFVILLLALLALVGVGVLLLYTTSRGWRLSLVGSHPPFARSAAYTGLAALLLALVGFPRVHTRLGPEAKEVVASIKESRFNKQDKAVLEHGYYEGLLAADKYTSAIWTVQVKKPDEWTGTRESGAFRKTGDLLDYELRPSFQGTYKSAPIQTNQWGMHDKEYTLEKPPQTYRIAFLGSSYEMGAGVEHRYTFASVLEDQLNLEHGGRPNYEILNFAVGGYGVVQNAVITEKKVFLFDPDILFYVVHSTEGRRLLAHLVNVVQDNAVIDDPELREIMRESGVTPTMEEAEIKRRLQPFVDEIIRWSFRSIVEDCREQGVTPVWIYVPSTSEIASVDQEAFAPLLQLGREAGFVILNMAGVYGDRTEAEVRLAPWDMHPNHLGHKLLADRLHQLLRENDQLLKRDIAGQAPPVKSLN